MIFAMKGVLIMGKIKKLKEVFIKKFNESATESGKRLQGQRHQHFERIAGSQSSPNMSSITEYVGFSIHSWDNLKNESCKTLEKYLKLIKPSEINIDKFYEAIRPTIDGKIDGHIRSLKQNVDEAYARLQLKLTAGAMMTIENQIIGINNFKKYFKDKICDDILFDYNIAPQDRWSRIEESVILIAIGAGIGNIGNIMDFLKRILEIALMKFNS